MCVLVCMRQSAELRDQSLTHPPFRGALILELPQIWVCMAVQRHICRQSSADGERHMTNILIPRLFSLCSMHVIFLLIGSLLVIAGGVCVYECEFHPRPFCRRVECLLSNCDYQLLVNV